MKQKNREEERKKPSHLSPSRVTLPAPIPVPQAPHSSASRKYWPCSVMVSGLVDSIRPTAISG